MRFGTFDRNEVRDNKVGYKIDSSFAIGIHLIKMKLHNALVIVQVISKYWWHWWHNIMVIKSRQAKVPQRVHLWHRQQHLVVWSISIDKIAPRELQWKKLPETIANDGLHGALLPVSIRSLCSVTWPPFMSHIICVPYQNESSIKISVKATSAQQDIIETITLPQAVEVPLEDTRNRWKWRKRFCWHFNLMTTVNWRWR